MLKKIIYSSLLILFGCSSQELLPDSKGSYPLFINPSLTINYRLDNVSNIDSLKDQFSAIWSDDMSFLVQSADTEKKQYKVNSCKSMLFAHENNDKVIYIPSPGPYNAMYVDCQAMFIVTNKATPSVKSYIQDYNLTKENIQNLPKSMALIISTSRYNDIHNNKKFKTIEDVNHIVKVNQESKFTSIAEDDSGGVQEISIIAKGDFNHDHIEDIMLSVSNSVIGGSYASHFLFILTKTHTNGNWIVLNEYPKQ